MTHRERFFKTVRHERPDYPPLDLWLRPEIVRGLQHELRCDDVTGALGMTFASAGVGSHFPAFEAKAAAPTGGDWPGADGRYIWHDERTFEDAWGVIQKVGEDQKLVEWMGGPLMDADDPDAYDFPGLETLGQPEDIVDAVAALKAADKVVLGGMTMPFKQAWALRGLENFLCDLIANQDFAARLYDKIYDYQIERGIRAAKAGVDVVTVTGDIAMNDRLLYPPEVFRQLDVPRLERMVARIREVRPDILFFYHSDGDISSVMDDFISLGFDCINPIQPECMDPNTVKRRWGDKITMWGTISVRTTIPNGTPESIREEVHHRIRDCGSEGGLVIGPANMIMHGTPIENVIALADAVREFRW